MTPELYAGKAAGKVMSEDGHQVVLFHWCDLAKGKYPELAWLYAVPNGGLRSKAVAGKLKAGGVKAGVLDLHLDVARKGFHGLRIELKVPEVRAIPGVTKRTPPGRISPEQQAWIDHHIEQGYNARVAYGWTEAMEILVGYLS